MNPNSILTTLAEIEANPLRGLIDPEEKREALDIIERIEQRREEATNA